MSEEIDALPPPANNLEMTEFRGFAEDTLLRPEERQGPEEAALPLLDNGATPPAPTRPSTVVVEVRTDNNSAPNDDALRRRRGLQFCLVHVAFHAFFLLLCALSLYLAPPWQHQECPLRQRLWAPVWCGLMSVHAALLALGLLVRWGIGPRLLQGCGKGILVTQRCLRLISTVWFFLGLRPLFWDLPCDRAARVFGRVLWYAHATAYLLPLFLYLGLCLCFPCIVLALNRLRPVSANESPTPPEILEKIERMEFRKFVETCRQRGHQVSVEAGAFVTEPLRTNPIVESLAGSSGPGPEESEALRIDKVCPVCLADFADDDIIAQMPCDFRHVFHSDCVKAWLSTSQKCPICRANVVELILREGEEEDDGANNNDSAPAPRQT